jgi:tRNA pseudouridine13 synthase
VKLKVQPDDFEVEELMPLKLSSSGRFAIYRLEKRLWNTWDVIDFIKRKYRLGDVRRAGLKDRYSHSFQYVSIKGTGPRNIREHNFELHRLGQANEPVSLALMTGNRFRIVLRDMSETEVAALKRNRPDLERYGFANFYDEQRFGSSRHGEGHIAHKLILGHFNGALKLYMATPSAYDEPETRRNKAFLERNWGDWQLCLKHSRPEYTMILRYLTKHPRDFEGALLRVRHEFLSMFLNSYQSYLWNETLNELILSFELPTVSVPYSGGEMLFFRQLNSKAESFFAAHEIPVAAPHTRTDNERIVRALNTVLTREGLTLGDMKPQLRLKGLFFKAYSRRGVVKAEDLAVSRPLADDLYPGRKKVELAFRLPPGCYATAVIKRLLLDPPRPPPTG